MDTWKHKILAAALVILIGCKDAPRDNALDPLSPSYRSTASVVGHVYLMDENTAVASVEIFSEQDSISVFTDAHGYFAFPHLSIGTQTLLCKKENFIPDTQQITVQNSSSNIIIFYIDGAPEVVSQAIVTRKIDQYYPSPQYFVDVSASVTDPNGMIDVDSVWFTVDTIQYSMSYSGSAGQYQIRLYKYDFPTNTIQWLVNKPLAIRSKDRRSAVNYSSSFYVSRIIENTATPAYPITNATTEIQDTTGTTPTFKWSAPDVTFNYTYLLTLSLVASNVRTVIWVDSNIVSSTLNVQYTGSSTLIPGQYVWTISVVDDFGNYSQSKEASFFVQ